MDIASGRIYVKELPGKGRGVFSFEAILPGEIVEICPVIPLGEKDLEALGPTALFDYYFLWGKKEKQAAIALGFGSLYNHDYAPNAAYEMYFEEKIIVVYALREIAPHEEITFNYNGEPDDQQPVWFDTEAPPR
jgi:SET domain-containing protein